MKRRRKHVSVHTLLSGWKIPVATGNQQVGVESVSPITAQTLQWNFTSPVASSPGSVPQLTASANGTTFVAPTSVAPVDGGIAATYSGVSFTPGAIFAVNTPPAGVTFAQGSLSVPQVGQVISQEEAIAIKAASHPLRKRKKRSVQAAAKRAARLHRAA
jgi:hypothetical protein